MRVPRLLFGFIALLCAIGISDASTVICEPEPGSGPDDEADPPGPYGYHTTNSVPFLPSWDYWYEVTPGAGESINYFELYTGVQYDSELDFFLHCYQPAGWTNGVSTSLAYGKTIFWTNVSGNALSGAVTGVFGFDHRNEAVWGEWSAQGSGVVVDSSTNHVSETNGYGYLVHVPGDNTLGHAEVFVATNGAHVYPFTNWATAARDFVSALDAAGEGGIVYVSNGTYRVTNEIVVGRSMTIRSMNGPGETVVDAGSGAITTRCFSLISSGAVLRGFTIRGGSAVDDGGGVLIGMLCTVDDCIIESNTARNGAGLYVYYGWGSRVQNCIIRNNSARDSAGGFYAGAGTTITNCLFVNNYAASNAGGLSILYGEVSDCEIRGNTALANAGGARADGAASFRNCLIVENSCSGNGGGVYFARPGEVVSCTVASNSAGVRGGGVFSTAYVAENPPGCLYYSSGGTVRNSILHGNTAPADPNCAHVDFNWIYDHVCAVPRPLGFGNLDVNPRFAAGSYRLSSDSPCINAGSNKTWMAGAADVYGEARITWDVVDIGADEFASEPLACRFDVARPSGVSPLTNVFAAQVQGTNTAGVFYRWDFNGDGIDEASGYGLAVVTNVFSGYSNVSVQITVTNSAGEIAAHRKDNCVRTGPAEVYVSLASASAYPYESWGTSATALQDAVNVAVDGSVVFVSNGVYAVTNEVRVGDGASIVGVGGAQAAIVDGRGSNRCFYLNHERAVVDGFTIRNGKAQASQGFPNGSGGGVFVDCGGTLRNCAIVSNNAAATTVSGYGGGGVYCWQGGLVENCRLQGNTSGHDGGGIECWHGGTVRDCLIDGNTTAVGGGGALFEGDSVMESCTIVSNTAGWYGGGTYSYFGGEFRHCIISSNNAPYDSGESLLVNVVKHEPQKGNQGYFRSCIPEGDPEDPLDDRFNLVIDPRFRSVAARDYRLATNSPCIDVGINASWMAAALDLEGKPRIINGTVDIGAYESIPASLDSDNDAIPDWWEWDWAHSLTNMDASGDEDDDKFINLFEYQAGTRPLDADSFLGLLTPLTRFTEDGIVVQWQSSSNKSYRLERATNLVTGFNGTAADDIPASPPMNIYTDTTAVLNGPYMYRVRTLQ